MTQAERTRRWYERKKAGLVEERTVSSREIDLDEIPF